MLLSGLNLTSCGDKKPFPSKSQISYFLPSPFSFPQTIWQSQPALANCWKQMYFSLEQAPPQQAGDGHHSIFCKWLCSWQSSLHHHTLPCAPPACVPVCLWCFEAGRDEEGLHEEEKMESWRACSGCRGLCHQEQQSVRFPPLNPPICLYTKPSFPGG